MSIVFNCFQLIVWNHLNISGIIWIYFELFRYIYISIYIYIWIYLDYSGFFWIHHVRFLQHLVKKGRLPVGDSESSRKFSHVWQGCHAAACCAFGAFVRISSINIGRHNLLRLGEFVACLHVFMAWCEKCFWGVWGDSGTTWIGGLIL